MKRAVLSLAGTVAVAVAAVAVIVPERSDLPAYGPFSSWLSHVPEVAAAEVLYEARVDSMVELRALRRRLETRAAARALAPVQERLALTADARLPADLRARFAEKVQTEFADYPAPVGRVRVHLAVAGETVRGGYARSIVLPAAANDACTVVIEVPLTARRIAPRTQERLVGSCGFYARFGAAGSGMRAWLERTRGEVAAADILPTEHAATPAGTARRNRIAATDVVFVPSAAACAAGDDAVCSSLFDVRWRGRQDETPPSDVAAQARDVLRGDAVYPLAPASTHLAAMRAELGDERFAEVWRSATAPAEAYAVLEGRSVGTLVRDQMLREIEPHRPGPLAARVPMMLGVAVAGLCFGMTVRVMRRQRS
jgi:hypothetical protein